MDAAIVTDELVKGIDKMLQRSWVLGLTSRQKAILQAARGELIENPAFSERVAAKVGPYGEMKEISGAFRFTGGGFLLFTTFADDLEEAKNKTAESMREVADNPILYDVGCVRMTFAPDYEAISKDENWKQDWPLPAGLNP